MTSLEQAIEAEVARRLEKRLEEQQQMPRVFTVSETASKLRVSRSTVYKMLADGDLRRAPITRRALIPAAEVARVLGGAAS